MERQKTKRRRVGTSRSHTVQFLTPGANELILNESGPMKSSFGRNVNFITTPSDENLMDGSLDQYLADPKFHSRVRNRKRTLSEANGLDIGNENIEPSMENGHAVRHPLFPSVKNVIVTMATCASSCSHQPWGARRVYFSAASQETTDSARSSEKSGGFSSGEQDWSLYGPR